MRHGYLFLLHLDGREVAFRLHADQSLGVGPIASLYLAGSFLWFRESIFHANHVGL